MQKLEVVSRIGAALLGSYVLVWGLVSLGTVSLVWAGWPFGEANTAMNLLAFLLLLAAFLWAIAARSLGRVWAVFLLGGGLTTAAAWGLQSHLLAGLA